MGETITDYFTCCRPGCDKVGTILCPNCYGARYCGIACQNQHRKSNHKHICNDLKQQRISKWDEISVLASAYIVVFDKTRSLFDAIAVWRKVSAAKGQGISIIPLVSRLTEVQAILSSNNHIPLDLRDTKYATKSELSARFLCHTCLEVLEHISGPTKFENLPYIERLFQQLQDSFNFVTSFQQHNFAPFADPTNDAHEYSFLHARLLREHGIMFQLRGRQLVALGALTGAAEGCRSTLVVKSKVWQFHCRTQLELGTLLKKLGRLPEALSAFEEAYSVRCEWTGPADLGLQEIAVAIANILREMGDLERAEHFSRVTYEMVKDNHNSGVANSSEIGSAAGSRCQILSDVILKRFDELSVSSKEDVLVEAEALAREALARADPENKAIFNDALRKLLTILIQRNKTNSREIYLLALRMIRIRQFATPQTRTDRLGLSNGYEVLASILINRLSQDHKDCVESSHDEAEAGAACEDSAGERRNENKDGDEWNRSYMKMRAFYCLLRAITIYTIEEGDSDKLKSFMERLDTATFHVLGELVISGKVHIRSEEVEWRGTTWEAFIEEYKQKMDSAGRPDDVEGNSDSGGANTATTDLSAAGSKRGAGNTSAGDVDGEEPKSVSIGVRPDGTYSFSLTAGPREVRQHEYEIQLGFAYWALSNALKRTATVFGNVAEEAASDRSAAKSSMKINELAVLEEAGRTLRLAFRHFEGKVFAKGAVEFFSSAFDMKSQEEAEASGK